MIVETRKGTTNRAVDPGAPGSVDARSGATTHSHAVAAVLIAFALVGTLAVTTASAQCPSEVQIQSFTGAGRVTCPCFVPGEQAGAVFTAPPTDYPLEVLRVGIAWGSQFGGTPTSLEEAIHVYAGGLPDPGVPIFTLEGPLLNDGAINQFNLEPLPGEIRIDSGPFAVTLEFLNENAGNPFAPSVVHDNNGCQPGKNVVLAMPGGWSDACALGVSGDWVFFAIYRPCLPTADVGDIRVVSTSPVFLMPPRPNPLVLGSEIEFVLAQPTSVALFVHDVSGRRVARLASGQHSAGAHRVTWNGRDDAGTPVPSGVYFVELISERHRSRRTVLVTH